MLNLRFAPVASVIACLALVGCGGGSGGGGDSGGNPPPPPPPPPPTVQYVAPADSSFVAAVDPGSPTPYLAQAGAYAGARLLTTGTIVSGSPVLANQAGYSEIYKGSDGHLYRLDLSITGTPTARQVSSESNATRSEERRVGKECW